ncbi:MAG: 50S ribosomal protein L35 [Planctomycetota bacterium]
MPKVKTHKASQRRVRITKNDKILRRQCGVRHLLTNRSPKRKRNLRGPATTETTGYVKKFKRAHCGL